MPRDIFDEDSVSEFDMIAEDAENAEQLAEEYSAAPAVQEASAEQLEEIAEESVFELNDNESNVIYNARLRLEQAKLYEMLINHNLFEGVDASPEAIESVQNELKFYIIKRLEILLGLREPTAVKSTVVAAESPFNEVEIDFLKQLAYKGTFGATKEVEPPKTVKAVKPNPVTSPAQKLKSFVAPKPVKQEVKKTAPPPSPPPSTPTKKVVTQPAKTPAKTVPQKAAPKKAIEKPKVAESGMGRPLTEAEAIEIAKADLKTASSKPFHLMNAKEKAAKIAEVNARNRRPVAVNAVPMPDANQLEMKYMMQQQSGSNSKNSITQFNTILASALAAKKNRGELDE